MLCVYLLRSFQDLVVVTEDSIIQQVASETPGKTGAQSNLKITIDVEMEPGNGTRTI